MEEILVFIFFVIFTFCVFALARRYERNGLGYMILSFIISPILVLLILVCLGPRPTTRA